MAKKVNKEAKKQLLKSTKAGIREKIEVALKDIKEQLGEKKFKKRLKKAAVLFSEGIVAAKKTIAPKKEKKKIKKSAAPEKVVELAV